MSSFLFLDIDGVLNSITWWVERKRIYGRDEESASRDFLWELDPKTCLLLRDVVEDLDLQIVISSTWRIVHPFDQIKSLLSRAGMGDSAERIIGTTLDYNIGRHSIRGLEIATWLSRHGLSAETRVVILDDDADMGALMPFLVRTENAWMEVDGEGDIRDEYRGLNAVKAAEVKSVLENKNLQAEVIERVRRMVQTQITVSNG